MFETKNLGCNQFQDKSICENVPPNNILKVVHELVAPKQLSIPLNKFIKLSTLVFVQTSLN